MIINLDIIANARAAADAINEISGAIGKMVRVGESVANVIKIGVDFNATLETSRLGIAALVTSYADLGSVTGKAMTAQQEFNAALNVADGMQKRLKVAAIETAASYEDLLRAMQEGMPSAIQAGFNDKEIVEFTKTMTQAAGAMGIPFDQLGQELRGVFEVDLSKNSRIARALLGGMGESADKLRERFAEMANNTKNGQNELYLFLQERMQGFSQAGAASAETYSASLSNLKDAFQQALGEGTTGLTETLTDTMNHLGGSLFIVGKNGEKAFDPEIIAVIRDIAAMAGSAAKQAGELAEGFISVAVQFRNFAKVIQSSQISQKMADIAEAMIPFLNTFSPGKAALLEAYVKSVRKFSTEVNESAKAQEALAAATRNVDKDLKAAGVSFGLAGFSSPAVVKAAKERLGQLRLEAEAHGGASEAAKTYQAAIHALMKAVKGGSLSYQEFDKALDGVASSQARVNELGGKAPPDLEKQAKAAAKAAREAEKLAREEDRRREVLDDLTRSIEANNRASDTAIRQAELAAQMSGTDDPGTRDRLQMESDIVGQQQRLLDLEREFAEQVDKLRGKANAEGAAEEMELEIAQIGRRKKLEEEVNAEIVAIRAEADAKAREHALETIGIITKEWDGQMTYAAQLAADRVEAMYDATGESLSRGFRDSLTSLFDGESLQDSFDNIIDGFQDSWKEMLGSMVDEWIDSMKLMASNQKRNEKGEIVNASFSPGKQKAAQMGFAGVQGAGALYSIAQGGGTRTQNVTGGIVQGATAGASIGTAVAAGVGGTIWGAVIGAVIGAIAGSLAPTADKLGFKIQSINGVVTVTGTGDTKERQVAQAQRDINKVVRDVRGKINDILQLLPTSILEAVSTLEVGPLNIYDKIDPTKSSGDALRDFMQITLPEKLIESYKNIFSESFKALGVNEARLNQLGTLVGTFDPKEALDAIYKYVKTLVDTIEANRFLGLDIGAKFNEARLKGAPTSQEKLDESAERIKKLQIGLETLTHEDQVARIGQINEILAERYQTEIAYLETIRKTQEGVFKQIDDAKFGLALGAEESPTRRQELLRGKQATLEGKLAAATTPEEVAQLSGEIQAIIAQLHEEMKLLPAGFKTLIAGFEQLGKAVDPDLGPMGNLARLDERILSAAAEVAGLTDPEEQLRRGEELLAMAEARYAAERELIAEIDGMIRDLTAGINSRIKQIELETMTPQQRFDAAYERKGELFGGLAAAKDPADVARIAAELQSTIDEIYAETRRLAEGFSGLIEGFDALNESVESDPMKRFVQVSEQIGTLSEGFAELSPWDQLERGEKILDLAQERYQLERQLYEEINGMIAQIGKSIDDQIRSLEDSERGPGAMREELLRRRDALSGQLTGAKSPAEALAAAEGLRAVIGQLAEVTTQLRSSLTGLIDGFAEAGRILDPDLGPMGNLEKVSNRIVELSAGFDQLPLDEQIARGGEILDLTRQRNELEKELRESIKRTNEEIQRSISGRLADLELRGKGPGATLGILEDRRKTAEQGLRNAKTPEEVARYAEEIQTLTDAILSAAENLQAGFRTTIEGYEEFARSVAEAGRTPAERMDALAGRILELGETFSGLAPDEQIRAGEEILALTRERYELEQQLREAIRSTNAAVQEAISGRLADLELRGKGPGAALDILESRRRTADNNLRNAKSPEEVARYAAEIQTLTDSILSAAEDLREGFRSTIEGYDEFTREIADAAKTPAERIGDLTGRILSLSENFDGLSSDDQIARGREILDLTRERYELEKAYLAEITAAQEGVAASVRSRLEGIELDEAGDDPAKRLGIFQRRRDAALSGIGTAKSGADLQTAAAAAESSIMDIYNLTRERYEMEKRELQEIKGLQESIHSSIEDQIFEIEQGQRTPEKQVEALLAKQRALLDTIKTGKTPEEVERAVSQLQGNASKLLSLLGDSPAAAADIAKMLRTADEAAQKTLGGFAEESKAKLDALPNAAEEASKALLSLTTEVNKRAEELKAGVTGGDAAVGTAFNTTLNTLNVSMTALGTPIAAAQTALTGLSTTVTAVLAAMAPATNPALAAVFTTTLEALRSGFAALGDPVKDATEKLGGLGRQVDAIFTAMGAAITTTVAPSVTAVTGVIGTLTTELGKLPPPVKEATDALGNVKTETERVLGEFAEAIRLKSEETKTAIDTVTTALTGRMGDLNNAAGEAKLSLEQLRDGVDAALGGMKTAIETRTPEILTAIGGVVDGLKLSLEKLPDPVNATNAALDLLRDQVAGRFSQFINDVITSDEALRNQVKSILDLLQTGISRIVGPGINPSGSSGGSSGGGGIDPAKDIGGSGVKVGGGSMDYSIAALAVDEAAMDEQLRFALGSLANEMRESFERAPLELTVSEMPITVNIGAPVVNVRVTGSAERLIDEVVAEVSNISATRAVGITQRRRLSRRPL